MDGGSQYRYRDGRHFGENRVILLQTVAKWRCIKLCASFFLDYPVYKVVLKMHALYKLHSAVCSLCRNWHTGVERHVQAGRSPSAVKKCCLANRNVWMWRMEQRRIEAFEMWCFRGLLRPSRTHCKTNEWVLRELNETGRYNTMISDTHKLYILCCRKHCRCKAVILFIFGVSSFPPFPLPFSLPSLLPFPSAPFPVAAKPPS